MVEKTGILLPFLERLCIMGRQELVKNFTISGFGPANVFTVSRRRTWRPIAVAAPDERRGCSQAICSTGRYPGLIMGTCSPTILDGFIVLSRRPDAGTSTDFIETFVTLHPSATYTQKKM
jgi:hypothetical protein